MSIQRDQPRTMARVLRDWVVSFLVETAVVVVAIVLAVMVGALLVWMF